MGSRVAMLGMLLLKGGSQALSRGSAIFHRGLRAHPSLDPSLGSSMVGPSFLGSGPDLPFWVSSLNMNIPFQVALLIMLDNLKIGDKCRLLPLCNPQISCLMCTFMASQNTHDKDIDIPNPTILNLLIKSTIKKILFQKI